MANNAHIESDPDAGRVISAFDAIAEVFDTTFEASPAIQNLRARLYEEIEARVAVGSSVLDINCGTGIDAINLARRGINVLGLDISPNMIEQSRQKAHALGVTNVRFLNSSFEQATKVATTTYDLTFSNFGGLNCVQRLEPVAEELRGLTKESGYFIGVIMPRFSLWEACAGLKQAKWQYAFRRMTGKSVATGFRENSFDVYYHSPAYVRRAFLPWFTVENIIGCNIFSPPPGAASFVQHHPRMNSFLIRFDQLVDRLPLLRVMGDHYIIILKRTAA